MRSQVLKIVVVSPHRDDAAFSVGLALDAWLAGGHSVEVMNVFTRSAYAPYSDAESLHSNDRLSYVTALRAREDLAWTKLYRGALSLADLRLKDAPLRFRCSADEVLGRPVSPSDKAFAVLQKGLSRSAGHAFVLPLALGRHVDHVTASEAAVRAAGQLPCAFYEDLPYAARPDTADEIEAEVGSAVVDAAALLGEPLQPVFAAQEAGDASASVARKRSFALCYDSQIDDNVVEQIAGFATRYGGRERMWANAAWQKVFPAGRLRAAH